MRSKSLSNSSLIRGKPLHSRRRAQLSCDKCRVSKRKCDRNQPCSRCKMEGIECTFVRAAKTQEIIRKRDEEGKRIVNDNKMPNNPQTKSMVQEPLQQTNTLIRDHALQSPQSFGPETSSLRSELSVCNISPETQFTSPPDSIAGIDILAHIARINSQEDVNQVHSSDRQQQQQQHLPEEKSTVDHLIDTPFFISRMFSLYVENVDWISDLLRDTRVDKIIAKYPCQPKKDCPADLWKTVYLLIYVIIALTSQMCPTEVESILEDLQVEGMNAQKLSLAAFEIANTKLFDDPNFLIQEPAEEWPIEHFAACMLLQSFRKNLGCFVVINSSFKITIKQFEKAFSYKEPFKRRKSNPIKQDLIMPKEMNLLIYRMFWSIFEKDRIRAWMEDIPYSIRSEDCQICFRTSSNYHGIFINDQEIKDDVENPHCNCFGIDGNLRLDFPKLTKFGYLTSRIGLLAGRYNDHVKSCSKALSLSDVLQDANKIATRFDPEDWNLRNEIMKSETEGEFRPGQAATLQILFHNLRSNFATRLCKIFAINVLKDSQSSSSQQAILWMLERRRNLVRMELLEEGRRNCSSLLKASRTSYCFAPSFVHIQLKDFINSIQPWFSKYDSTIMGYEKMLPMQFVKKQMYNHLADCFEAIFRGRNTLVLLTRRNELPRMALHIQEICSMLQNFMIQSGLYVKESQECLDILDSKSLIDLTKFNFPKFDRPCFNLEPDLNQLNSNQIISQSAQPITTINFHNQEDSLALLINNDSSILSTLNEIDPNSIQEALETWNVDLDKLFDDMPDLRNFLMLN